MKDLWGWTGGLYHPAMQTTAYALTPALVPGGQAVGAEGPLKAEAGTGACRVSGTASP